MTTTQPRTLSAPVSVGFDYTRSVGPTLGAFFDGLRDRVLLAGRLSDNSVVIPPPEFDPATHDPVSDLIEVGPLGTVVSWTWVPEPVRDQPFDRPFAYALVQFDGATAPFLHALDAAYDDLSVGIRVQVRWRNDRVGAITDIACFEPVSELGEAEDREGRPDRETVAEPDGVEGGEDGPDRARPRPRDEAATEQSRSGDVGSPAVEEGAPAAPPVVEEGAPAPVSKPLSRDPLITPVNLDYTYAASPEESAFFRGLAEGRILGQRCPACGKVYVPPRGACPVDGVPTTDEVELPGTGTVTTFCIVNVPFMGQKITPPYVSAYVLLDGADIAFLHLILDVPAEEVRMGMRVEAVWRPREEWGTSVENISHFAPTGEPDADFESYKVHL